MDINSTEFAQSLNNIIEQKVRIIVQQELKSYGNLRAWDAIVTSVNENTANVHLIGDSTEIVNLKNKSGVILEIGDEVYLQSISSLSNAFISYKK